MLKFKAPEHVTSIFTGGTEYRADKNGIATLPHDAPAAHAQALEASGWTRLDAAAKSPAAPRKPSGKRGSKKSKPAAPAPAEPPAGDE